MLQNPSEFIPSHNQYVDCDDCGSKVKVAPDRLRNFIQNIPGTCVDDATTYFAMGIGRGIHDRIVYGLGLDDNSWIGSHIAIESEGMSHVVYTVTVADHEYFVTNIHQYDPDEIVYANEEVW